MPDSSLRGKILRLAVQSPGLRPSLTRVLREAGGLTEAEEKVLKKANGGVTFPEAGGIITSPVAPVVTDRGQPIVIQQIVNQGPGAIQPAPAAPAPIAEAQRPLNESALGETRTPSGAPAPIAEAQRPLNESALGETRTPSGDLSVSALGVPERAAHGFNAELLPEMDKLLAAGLGPVQVGRDMWDLVQGSFSRKDSLYNILIRYQSSFESNEEYLGNFERLIEAWVTSNGGA